MKLKNSLPGTMAMVAVALLTISAFTIANNTNEPLADARASMIADWQWAKDYTLQYIESMPESGINAV